MEINTNKLSTLVGYATITAEIIQNKEASHTTKATLINNVLAVETPLDGSTTFYIDRVVELIFCDSEMLIKVSGKWLD